MVIPDIIGCPHWELLRLSQQDRGDVASRGYGRDGEKYIRSNTAGSRKTDAQLDR